RPLAHLEYAQFAAGAGSGNAAAMSAAPNPSQSSQQRASMRLRTASLEDDASLMHIINAAFVVERVAFDGDRVDLEGVRLLLSKGTFLIAEAAATTNQTLGCVYVEPRSERCYLGLLSVSPSQQGRGIGRQLTAAAENFARNAGCTAMDLRIISP